MSREIKFRVWKSNQKEWVQDNQLWEFACETRKLNEVFTDRNKHYGDDFLIFQQFTGLIDKNSKEIYEGDIIFVDELLWEVEFRLGAFMVIPLEDEQKQGDYGLLYEYYKDCSVEGNIFENNTKQL